MTNRKIRTTLYAVSAAGLAVFASQPGHGSAHVGAAPALLRSVPARPVVRSPLPPPTNRYLPRTTPSRLQPSIAAGPRTPRSRTRERVLKLRSVPCKESFVVDESEVKPIRPEGPTHEDGKFVSMSGLISGSYSLSQATNVPVVLERIHASYETKTGKIVLDEKLNKRLAIIELKEMQKDHAAILRRLTLKIDDGIIKL